MPHTIDQFPLFSQVPMIKNQAIKALINLDFIQSERYWLELKRLDPDDDHVIQGLKTCRFWKDAYLHHRETCPSALETYQKWTEFEAHLDPNRYWGKAETHTMKRTMFLDTIGLGNITPALRASLAKGCLDVLDLFEEIQEWELAEKEIRAIRTINPAYGDGSYFLKCSKVYYKIGDSHTSRSYLLQTFWDAPDLIALRDIIDSELCESLESFPIDSSLDESVELIPYAGLMDRLFSLPSKDQLEYLRTLQMNAEWQETDYRINSSARVRYRLFSLYAWISELAQRIGENHINSRRKMQEKDRELFADYMHKKERIRKVPGRP